MIDPKAEPIGHRNPYKRIEVGGRLPWRARKAIITREEIEDGLEPKPDPDLYWQDLCGNWHRNDWS